MERTEISVSEVISQGWELVKQHGLLLACIVLCISILSNVVSLLFAGPSIFSYVSMMENIAHSHYNDERALEEMLTAMGATSVNFSSAITSLVATITSAALLAIILQLAKGTITSVQLSPCKMPVMTYIKYIAVGIFNAIIIGFGTLLCIIPGIYLAVKLKFVQMYILDHPESGIGEAYSASWNMTAGNFWSLFCLNILNIIINCIGLLICCIGALFSDPFTKLNDAVAYYQLLPNANQAAAAATEDADSNYAR